MSVESSHLAQWTGFSGETGEDRDWHQPRIFQRVSCSGTRSTTNELGFCQFDCVVPSHVLRRHCQLKLDKTRLSLPPPDYRFRSPRSPGDVEGKLQESEAACWRSVGCSKPRAVTPRSHGLSDSWPRLTGRTRPRQVCRGSFQSAALFKASKGFTGHACESDPLHKPSPQIKREDPLAGKRKFCRFRQKLITVTTLLRCHLKLIKRGQSSY